MLSLFNCSLLIDFLFDVLFSRLKKYFELVSPSSYHFIRDLIIAPSVLLFIILFNYSFLLLISSWTKLVSNCIEPEVELSWSSRCCIWFSRISICLFIFFLNLAPYFMDSPLIAVFTTSHNRFGFAFIFVVTVSLIVFFISVTNSNSFKWLQLSFQNPFPLSLTIGMKLTLIKEWSDLYPGEMFEDIIFSVMPYETRKKSNRQKIGDGLFLYQVYTCESGCCNRQMSTRSVSSIQFFTRVCDFIICDFLAALFIII